MKNLYLVTPSLEHKEMFIDMIEEWEATKERIYPAAIRRKGLDYTNWLKNLQKHRKIETCPVNYVPSDTYFLYYNNRLIGGITIRHYLNEDLLKFSGHIGYGVRPSERRKGYATKMLKLGLEKCVKLGLKEVLVTCDKDNIGSAKTILTNNGVLENELTEEDGNMVQRYWIHLD